MAVATIRNTALVDGCRNPTGYHRWDVVRPNLPVCDLPMAEVFSLVDPQVQRVQSQNTVVAPGTIKRPPGIEVVQNIP